jgi:phospholipid/cholesterol/gamma-HCH transport system substrate-binding protein
VVGAFVLGGFALAVLTIVLLGSGRFFQQKTEFVLYFSSDVNGLRVGAPVKFRGVEIGSVKRIMLNLGGSLQSARENPADIRIPVIIEINQHQIISHGVEAHLDDPAEVQRLINEGLRGQLAVESILTGLLYVDLEMYPNTPAHYYLGRNAPLTEIPTVPTTLEQAQMTAQKILAQFEKIDFGALIKSLTETASALHDLVSAPKLKQSIASLNDAAVNLSAASASIGKVANTLDSRIGPMSDDLRATTEQARAALKQTQETLAAIQASFAPGSPIDYELQQALSQTSQAARSVRQLSDYLQRNPSAVLRGRATSGE